jgi:septum formation protein
VFDKIYLASKSPRRRELLEQMNISYELLLLDTPEELIPNETPYNYSYRVTEEKLIAAWNKITSDKLPLLPILCADTEVVINDKILGKPNNYDEAFAMLKSYSNAHHEVITTIGIKYNDKQIIKTSSTIVYFSEITENDIHKYLATGDYQDKSGSYGIQSYIGQFISRIDGCFYSVMGLPLNLVRKSLLELSSLK